MPRAIDSDRVGRSLRISTGRVANTVRLVEAEDVDDEVRAWLTEAYDAAG